MYNIKCLDQIVVILDIDYINWTMLTSVAHSYYML